MLRVLDAEGGQIVPRYAVRNLELFKVASLQHSSL